MLVNHARGEVQGIHVPTLRSVAADTVVKLFTQHIALTFDLKAAGIKASNVLMWILQSKAIDKDLITLDKFVLEEFIVKHKDRKTPIKLSLHTLGRGLVELEHAQIIATHILLHFY